MTPSVQSSVFAAQAAASSGSSSSSSSNSSSSASSPEATKDMFMKLLVAQIQNQDPLNPADSIQYVTQLAQFEQLEQTVNMSSDITGIHQDLDKLVAASASGGTTTQSSSTSKS